MQMPAFVLSNLLIERNSRSASANPSRLSRVSEIIQVKKDLLPNQYQLNQPKEVIRRLMFDDKITFN